MVLLSDVNLALDDLKALLGASPQGTLSPTLAEQRIGEVLSLLTQQEPRWIGASEVIRLLGSERESAVAAWVRHGLLRGRTRHDGCLEVRLDDVLSRRLESEGLLFVGGDELTSEELRVLRETTPGTTPWERARSEPSS